jgi:hypothetical protein
VVKIPDGYDQSWQTFESRNTVAREGRRMAVAGGGRREAQRTHRLRGEALGRRRPAACPQPRLLGRRRRRRRAASSVRHSLIGPSPEAPPLVSKSAMADPVHGADQRARGAAVDRFAVGAVAATGWPCNRRLCQGWNLKLDCSGGWCCHGAASLGRRSRHSRTS